MNWYYTIGPAHTRVRIFMNGANCGELCFRNEEFKLIVRHYADLDLYQDSPFNTGSAPLITFIDKTEVNTKSLDRTPK